MNVLIIEDERKVAKALADGLERERFAVTVAANGEDGFFLINARPFDIILLDLNLPGRDGIEVLSTMRQKGIRTPVLILTARDAVESKVAGLESGADDYLVKPFAFPELVARMRVLLRRGRSDGETLRSLGDLELDLMTRKVTRANRPIQLTTKEFDLLEFFLRNKNRIVSREMLVQDVWSDIGRATPLDNVIDVHIAHLRRKIDEGFPVRLLHTVRGVGFLLSESQP